LNWERVSGEKVVVEEEDEGIVIASKLVKQVEKDCSYKYFDTIKEFYKNIIW
jgi:hypothetical protein